MKFKSLIKILKRTAQHITQQKSSCSFRHSPKPSPFWGWAVSVLDETNSMRFPLICRRKIVKKGWASFMLETLGDIAFF